MILPERMRTIDFGFLQQQDAWNQWCAGGVLMPVRPNLWSFTTGRSYNPDRPKSQIVIPVLEALKTIAEGG
jgi:hypothetical protein